MKSQYILNDQGESFSANTLEISEEIKKVLDKRLDDYYLNKDEGKHWDVIKAEILK